MLPRPQQLLTLALILSLAPSGFVLAGQTETSDQATSSLTLEADDHICIVGGALGERLQHYNGFESILHQAFPEKRLVVRNLGFPGDEIDKRDRSENFGSPDKHLKHSEASVVMYFFGFNESFKGARGIPSFKERLAKLIKETKAKNYGKGSPRVVLVSPIAFEDTGRKELPNAPELNEQIRAYRDAMVEVAKETETPIADVFEGTLELFENTDEVLTLNGSHLNAVGYRKFAPILFEALFDRPAPEIDPIVEELVDDKNFHWWHRYRAVNGFSIYGKRGQAGKDGTGRFNNEDVMEREREILDQMTAARDQSIWIAASGKEPPAVDDAKTLPFLDPTTNVGLPDDPNAKRGKLGSLEYRSAREQLDYFDVHPDFQIELVASEEDFPDLANPVALNFDSKGRLWVATMPSYPHWKPKTQLNDKILILEDQNGDGATDNVKVFADGLHQPTGFELTARGAIVAEQPDILWIDDTDGDDVGDTSVRKLFGFDTADSHHGIAAFEWGPTGRLFFQEGTFKFSQVESPHGPLRLQEAGIWGYDPVDERIEVFANFAFANPWGHVFDGYGQSFIGDASPGYSYWSAPITGRLDAPMKHPGGSQHRRVASLGGGDPKYSHPRLYKKRIRPLSGCALVSSNHFPESMQGNFLVTNVIGDRGVLNHEIRETAVGFEGEEVDPLLLCRDGNFRPVDVQIGPDGALYIVDWHNALIGHLQHNLRDPSRDHSHGRIWRLRHRTRPLSPIIDMTELSVAELVGLLDSNEDRVRYRARRELAGRDDSEVLLAAKAWLKTRPAGIESDRDRLEAYWLHHARHVESPELLDQLLASSDHRVRSAAVRTISQRVSRLESIPDSIEAAIDDDHGRVRLEALRTLTMLNPTTSDALGSIVSTSLRLFDHPIDAHLQYTLDESFRRFDQLAEREGFDIPVNLGVGEQALAFQLNRLPTERLTNLVQELSPSDRKLVLRQLISRSDVDPELMDQAIDQLAEIQKLSPLQVMIAGLEAGSSANLSQSDRRLIERILSVEPSQLTKLESTWTGLLRKNSGKARVAASAVLMALGRGDQVWKRANDESRQNDVIAAVGLLPKQSSRNEQTENLLGLVTGKASPQLRVRAIGALARTSNLSDEVTKTLSPMINSSKLRESVAKTLLERSLDDVPASQLDRTLKTVTKTISSYRLEDRSSGGYRKLASLARDIARKLSSERAKEVDGLLDQLKLEVVKLTTVEEEMRYDVPYFAVEAGSAVQIQLTNDDLMPHNLVITKPGELKAVANEGLSAGPKAESGLPYVPSSESVLVATAMVDVHQTAKLTFTAPTEPGNYPYVCTYPQHWYRMYGVMVVVDDLEAWKANPIEPPSPIGMTRSFVADWKIEDFKAELPLTASDPSKIDAETIANGAVIFQQASCVGCHQVGSQPTPTGGNLGPNLAGIYARMKNDDTEVLRSILHPSEKIEDKYLTRKVLTFDQDIYIGLVLSETDDELTLATGAGVKPIVISQDDIEIDQTSDVSLMPKALMNQYTLDEIKDLLGYLKSLKAE
ncbi:MAG: PVC-type heme-binding CxxCH protein [Planctomycetota bacterium]